MKAVRRRAAGAQILMTEHVEQLWLTGYKCAAHLPSKAPWCAARLGSGPVTSLAVVRRG